MTPLTVKNAYKRMLIIVPVTVVPVTRFIRGTVAFSVINFTQQDD